MPIRLGTVGHFSLAVKDPKLSARWWTSRLNLVKQFEFDGGVAVGNDAITIALFKGRPRPEALEHMSFHVSGLRALRSALSELKRKKVDLEDPGDEIGPEGPGSKNMGLWFHDPDGYRWELSAIATPRHRRRKPRRR
ncbi:MAG: VOC family protein [Candidatus Eremiobacteraeota bacterium]|nr:VOC family protein [Candidatus Eremiobacteraeota bacterium]